MPDTPPEGAFRLIYRSRTRIPEHHRKAELGRIFTTARAANKKAAITGALLLHGEWFIQALEGEESAVRALYERIRRDGRHERIALVDERTTPHRVFGRWSMARVSDDGESDVPLLTNRDKGGISPAARRPTTPEQDALLAFMRDAVPSDVPSS
jgi:hypothetical protein